MTVKINYTNLKGKISTNIVLFVNDKFSTKGLNKFLSNEEFNYINDLLKTSDLKKNIFIYEVNSKKKIVLVSIKNNLKKSDIENLGAEFYGRINQGKKCEYIIVSDSIANKQKIF